MAIPSRFPRRSAEKLPPEPAATSPTPASETAAASQKRLESRSSPSASPISAAMIGVAPSSSASVDAVEASTA